MKTTEFLKENSIIAQEADDMHKDHEVQMARSQMYSAAQSAIEIHRLLKNISELEGLDGWVASKLTLASEYLETVRDYLKYEAVSAEPEMMEFVSEAAEYAFDTLVAEDGYKDWSEKNPGKLNKQTADMYDRNTHRWGGDTGVPGAKEHGGKDELKTVDRKGNPSTNLATRIEKPEGVPKVSKKPITSFGGGGVGRSGGMGGTMDPSAVKSLIPNFESKQAVKENASAGASGAGGIAVSMGGPGHKPTTGVPKRVGNSHKPKKVTVGKGVY
jgi:hypothetical protein